MRLALLGLAVSVAAWSSTAHADPPETDGGKAPLVVAAPEGPSPTTDVPPAIAPRASATVDQATNAPPPLAKAPPNQGPPPPPYVAPKKPKRWYGWQVLLVHGLSDMIVVGGLIGMEAGDPGGGFVATAVAPMIRGLSTGILEAAHDGTAAGVLWGAGSFMLPLLGAAGMGGGLAGDRVRKEDEDVEPVFARGWAAGMLLGGSVMTAIEASVAFEDKPATVGVNVSPSFVSVNVAF